MGQQKETDGRGFWAADGMGYGDGLEGKLKRKEKKERRREMISAERGAFLQAEDVRVGDIQTREREVALWNILVRSSVNP